MTDSYDLTRTAVLLIDAARLLPILERRTGRSVVPPRPIACGIPPAIEAPPFPSMRSMREHGVLDGVHGAEDDGADLLSGRMPLFVAPAARPSPAGIAEPLRRPGGVSFTWAGCAGGPTSPRRGT
jgi:hypothetical protein